MKVLKAVLSAAGTAFFSGCMFFSFIAGAPEPRGNLLLYAISAAAFSILVPVFGCSCIHYILHLQKRIDELEKGR